jgi:hypothetical protein
VRIKGWLLFIRGVNTRRDIQLEKIVSEYDAKGGGRERVKEVNVSEWYVDGVDLIEMATLILENNYFEFDGKIYWQKQGTAIGTKFAPTLICQYIYVCFGDKDGKRIQI